MKYASIILILLFLFFLVRYIVNKEKLRKAVAKLQLEEDWNKVRNITLDEQAMLGLRHDYEYTREQSADEIDDITWNDFEMDGIYQKVNHTLSRMGEIALYRMLRRPVKDQNILEEREELSETFLKDDKLRIIMQLQLKSIGKRSSMTINECYQELGNIPYYSLVPHILFPLLLLAGIGIACLVNMRLGLALSLFVLIFGTLAYYKDRLKIDQYVPTFIQIGDMLQVITALKDAYGYESLQPYIDELNKIRKLAASYNKQLSLLKIRVKGRVTAIDDFADYLRVVTHLDLLSFRKLTKSLEENYELLCHGYEIVGYLDSMISIAQFKHELLMSLDEEHAYCKPVFVSDKEKQLKADDLYHPLLQSPVANDVFTEKSILITGSNATGKSTFLRTVGVNAILAQTFDMACAARYESTYFKIMSSMSMKDDIFQDDSYYMSEIKSLKRIIEASNTDAVILCCLDEVLRGTNTIERISAASEILEDLSQKKVLCIAASHDIELTYILEKVMDNYHFQEVVTEEGIECDFKLYEDRSYTRNAIHLLKLMGYPDQIVLNAQNKVENYLSTGKWKA